MRLVEVVWEDACEVDDTAWVFTDEPVYSPRLVMQVGYVVSDNDCGLILTSAYTENQQGRRMQIPRGMIREVRLLKD
jgi:hypothetical protein